MTLVKRTYELSGMTCSGCRQKVQDGLTGLPGVDDVHVDLENNKATLLHEDGLTLAELQQALPSKYTLKLSKTNVFPVDGNQTESSKLQQLRPLFLIFLFLFGATALLNYNPWSLKESMLDFMGLFYVVFSFFKLLDLKGFKNSFQMYDPLAKAIPAYGWIYPFIELGLGILFLMRVELQLSLIVTLVILGLTTIGVSRVLLRKQQIQCACLGTVLKLPMTQATLIENSIMLIMAIFMLLKGTVL